MLIMIALDDGYEWMNDWLIDWLVDLLIDWLVDWSVEVTYKFYRVISNDLDWFSKISHDMERRAAMTATAERLVIFLRVRTSFNLHIYLFYLYT